MAWGASPQTTAPPPPLEQQPPSPLINFLSVGTKVQFKTALGGHVTGNVVNFDAGLKVLAIKEQTTSGKTLLRVFNIELISDIKELSSATAQSEADALCLSTSALPQAVERRNAVCQKRMQEAMPEEVTYDGQRAFVQLRRTLDDVKWEGVNINALNRVIIKPPYTVDSIVTVRNEKQCDEALIHVQKILKKPFVADVALASCCK